MMLDVRLLDGARDGEDFAPLTFATYRPTLLRQPDTVCAVGAWRDGVPVGLALARKGEAGKPTRMLSVFVGPDERRCGIGGALVGTLVEHLADRSRLLTYYSSLIKQRQAFEALLATCGFAPPRLECMRAAGRAVDVCTWADRIRGPKLLENLRPYTVKALADCAAEDHAAIDALAAQPDFPAGFHPMNHATGGPTISMRDSLVLCHSGKPVGWLLSGDAGGTEVWYFSAYIRPDLERRGGLLMLFHEVHRRHVARCGEQARWRLTSTLRTPAMLAFIRTRFGNFADFVDEHLMSHRLLAGGDTVPEIPFQAHWDG